MTLSVQNLTVDYLQDHRAVSAVRNVSLSIEAGKTLGLVGESGCGKSTLALAIMRLLSARDSRTTGSILFKDQDLLALPESEMQRIRGNRIGMVFQDPFSALNPVLSVDFQLQEVIDLEYGKPDRQKAVALLNQVQLEGAERILDSYPHQLSGGQRQRVMIAMALARRPDLLIADEPTTALDVTVQDEIMKLLKTLKDELRMSMLFVTHNLGLVKSIADEVAVMYAGQIVERGSAGDVINMPKHPYTQALVRSQPKLQPAAGPLPMLEGQPPQPSNIPSGCPFHTRCPKVFGPCPVEDPEDRRAEAQTVRCHLY